MRVSGRAFVVAWLLVAAGVVHAESKPVSSIEEQQATRADLPCWLGNMTAHNYTIDEMSAVCGLPVDAVREKLAGLAIEGNAGRDVLRVLPYPGGRHPRIGFLEGAVNPQRGTKASLFLPWPDAGYVVLDLPEAVFSTDGLLFLAHTHDDAPTIWSKQGIAIPNVDWRRDASGALSHERELPNGIRIGATITPGNNRADLRLWIENGSHKPLSGLRTQVCLMLKGAPQFEALSNEGKVFETPVAAAPSKDGQRWILVAFDRATRIWGNAKVPCIHSDPLFPDAAPGQHVEVTGRVWFYKGQDVAGEIARGRSAFHPAETPNKR